MGIFRGTGGTGDSTTDTTVTTVTQKAAEAASSATSAANSATSAANSASSASTSATNAATSATNAANSATASATSATASETAKTAAQAAQTAAETAETNAETAEANAVTAKNQAVSAKDNAVTAQTAAETAETNAETAYANTLAIYGSTTDVQNAVNSASTSATNAATSATQAATSATNAANSATSAGTSETNAASSASQAATSAASANSYATDAQTAQTAAETAQAAAEAAEANINGLYLGSLANDPTLDGNGVAVTTGDLYFNTTEQEVRVYTDGDVWEPVVDLAGDITVNSLTSNNNVVVKGNLEVQGTTITVDSATAQTIDLGDNDKIRLGDTDDLQIYHDGSNSYVSDQGTGNLYLQGTAGVVLESATGDNYLYGLSGGEVALYHNNSIKARTTSTGVDITGNITVSGTVDGRDIAADGTTLDAVASTYVDVSGDTMTGNLNFNDSVQARYGASGDLRIYHDGSHSYISDQGPGNLRLVSNGNSIRLETNDENMLIANNNSSVDIYYDGAKKFATTSSGVDITGTVVADGLTVDGTGTTRLSVTNNTTGVTGLFGVDSYGLSIASTNASQLSIGLGGTRLKVENSGDISFYEDTGTTAKLTWDASAEELQFKDNVKAEFGDGGDLQIYHNGTNSRIDVNGGNDLQIVQNVNDQDIILYADDGLGGVASYFKAEGLTGEAILYHYGSQKLATKSTGIDVTGTITADQTVQVDGASPRLYLLESDATDLNTALIQSGGSFTLRTVNDALDTFTTRLVASHASGDIALYNDTGTSQDLYWDASTSRLGLGTTTPAVSLDVRGDGTFYSGASTTFTVGDGISAGESSIFNLKASYNGNRYFNFNRGTTVESRILCDSNEHLNIDFARGFSADFRIRRGSSSVKVSEFYDTGDIAFFDDSGASKDFYWDASTSRLGLGTTGPNTTLHLYNTGGTELRIESSANSDTGLRFQGDRSWLIQNDGNASLGGADYLHIYDSTAGASRLVIDTSGNVGIGTTSPTKLLEVDGDAKFVTTSGVGLQLHNDSSNQSYIQFTNTVTGETVSSGFQVGIDGAEEGLIWHYRGEPIKFATSNLERMRIDSNGRLGIGTTSPAEELHISASVPKIQIQDSDGTNQYGQFYHSAGSTAILARNGNADGQILFQRYDGTTTDESMRIDSSGNLLVGTTNSTLYNSTSDTGIAQLPLGKIEIARSGGTLLTLNRLSSDGTIQEFRKDGTTVGSIGTAFGNTYFASSLKGIRFRANDMLPVYSSDGSAVDAQIDLGISSVRWRNLYLSGGVYLGGTGSANLLDDYEEGTFTPAIQAGTFTYSNQNGKYVVVGKMVLVNLVVRWTAKSGTGNLTINLPFTANSDTNSRFTGSLGYTNGIDFGSKTQLTAFLDGGQSSINLFQTGDNSLPDRVLVQNCTSIGEIQITVAYQI